MGVISTRPMICNHCDEADIEKLATKKGKPVRICRKCRYKMRKANQQVENGDEIILLEIDAFCMNGCKWSRKVDYEKGTKPDTRVLCPSCKDRVQGNIGNCGVGNSWSFD